MLHYKWQIVTSKIHNEGVLAHWPVEASEDSICEHIGYILVVTDPYHFLIYMLAGAKQKPRVEERVPFTRTEIKGNTKIVTKGYTLLL